MGALLIRKTHERIKIKGANVFLNHFSYQLQWIQAQKSKYNYGSL